jgi:2-polyprenyl-3-methyl-5-hydroxy-6-metoxy-1,4-benzoquinol methylase
VLLYLMTERSVSVERILSSPAVLTGNTAKVRVLVELDVRLRAAVRPLRILDIGIVGPKPLEFWEPLRDQQEKFELSGIDVAGIERAEAAARERGWSRVQLRQGSGYELERHFARESFDIVVATQVLEHVAQLERFLKQVARVLRPGGECFFTVDSAHYRSRFDVREPVRLVKNVVKKLLALLGNERHYDLPWREEEVAGACKRVGLEVTNSGYYCLEGVKYMHNHIVPAEKKNEFMRAWFTTEDEMNRIKDVAREFQNRCMALYVQARKPAGA